MGALATARCPVSLGIDHLVEAATPTGPQLVAVVDATAAGTRAAVFAAAAYLRGTACVAAVRTPYEPAAPALLARDGRALAVTVDLVKGLSNQRQDAVEAAVRHRLAAVGGARVLVGGE